MTNNYRVIVHFDGTEYYGWQFQRPEYRTIQAELIRVLKIIAKKQVLVTGSSRTDAGVHSSGLTANFHLPITIEPESLRRALNSLLPKDIRIMECQLMDKSFNARFGAHSKTYVYRIFTGQVQSPFSQRYALHIPFPLDVKAMRRAARHFVGSKDFSSFTSDDPGKKRTREVDMFKMQVKNEEITFSVRGKSFLRYMVRNMVGTLIDVGKGKIKAEEIPAIFAAKDRRRAGQTAPAKGLTLVRVEYEPQPGKE
ncbi:MAG: tRNA pseudouridine(38-40) synthase TruA [Acidobacteria bacterium]|nr:tRNA pseudouridine(38-40) synthase TruA [Acidobacteriota bacterium]MBU4306309.1 tRNA pseudouridine(38-40) synthase TruA [Acidobacteriota bacterium]MBU4404844.1 tRNA pseudouridine(38-40) synthase TruA [Acidobacteriota bacterium]MCG2812373.1 tRNA pseudouridine(38-40) synthase TruA [Candidatus Aminicenantes bacterium]